MKSKTENLKQGLLASVPCMIGVVPFGLAYSILAVKSGLTVFETLLMSATVFAGSAQFMFVEMVGNGMSFGIILISTVLINLRHLLMGISLSQYLSHVRRRYLAGLSFGMTDETYAVSISHYKDGKTGKGSPLYMLGSIIGMYTFWLASTVVGSLIGLSIEDPLAWGLDFAMPATFVCILIPQIKNLRYLVVVIVSAAVTIIAYQTLPDTWYIIIGSIAATVVGVVIEVSGERRRAHAE